MAERTTRLYLTGICLSVLAGCAHTSAPATRPGETPSVAVRSIDGSFEGRIFGTPAPRSKFAKLRIGMPMKQVTDLIGEPNDTDAHISGKAFIPFYFGGDTVRAEAFYRNEGHLTYSGSHFGGVPNRLLEIHVNPDESGYAH